MLILENGEKIMEDGLETKEPGFLVNQVYVIHKKQDKAESAIKHCLLILDVHKVVKINPESEIKHSWGIDDMR